MRPTTDVGRVVVVTILVGAASLLVPPPAAALSISSEFTGPGSAWTEPANWSPLLASYPRNDPTAGLLFEVTISTPACPASGVRLDESALPVEVDRLTLAPGCRLVVGSGSDLHVVDEARLAGRIDVESGRLALSDRILANERPGQDGLEVFAGPGSTLDLGEVEKIVGQALSFESVDGALELENLTRAATLTVDLEELAGGPGASLAIDGVVQVFGASRLRPTTAEVRISGALVHDQTDPAAVDLSSAVVTVTDWLLLEVGGRDVSTDCSLLADSNFGIGPLVIDDPVEPVRLHLFDLIDNGHRGGPGGPGEALYLFGPGTGDPCSRTGGDGLVLRPGSRLWFATGAQIYVYSEGSAGFVHLNPLFDGSDCIQAFGGEVCTGVEVFDDTDGDQVPSYPYDNCVVAPNGPYDTSPQLDVDQDGYGDACDADYDQDGFVTAADFGVFLSELGRLGELADHDGDGSTTVADFSVFLSQFGDEPGPSGVTCADPTIRVAEGDAPCEASWP